MKKINVLSLFDGIGGGRIALDIAEVPINTYYASEIDKYAMGIMQKNYPETVQLGDVRNWRNWDIDWKSIDLLIGGSPCQGFSCSGKQLNFNDPRSALFFEYVNILNRIKEVNPNVKFLLENVRMKKEWEDVISKFLGVKPVLINSALITAQNRHRLYWANWEFKEPIDKGINLGDIIENGLAVKVTNQGKVIEEAPSKSSCLMARDWKGFGNQCMTGVIEPTKDNKNSLRILILKNGEIIEGSTVRSKVRIDLPDGEYTIRMLSPIEYERLQSVPDNYTAVGVIDDKVVKISKTQRYSVLGNGWTSKVIAHILSNLTSFKK